MSSAFDLRAIHDAVIGHCRARGGVEDGEPELLALLAAAFHCQWATYWKVDAGAMKLLPLATWSDRSVDARRLARDTSGRRLSLSEGTAGHVWRSRKPVWSANLVQDMCLPRSLGATTVGLQGGIWFALKTDVAVYGVIELLGRAHRAAGDEALAAVEQLGIALGRFVEAAHLHRIAADRQADAIPSPAP